MATNLKENNGGGSFVFKGVLSWVSALLLLILASALVGLGIALLIDFSLWRDLSDFIIGLRYYPHELGLSVTMLTLYALAVLGILALLLFFTFGFRKARRAIESAVGRALGHIWVEVKLAALAVIYLPLSVTIFRSLSWGWYEPTVLILLLPYYVLGVYFLCLDIGKNRRYFGHNIVHSVTRLIATCRSFATLEEKAMRRAIAFCAVPLFFLGASVALFGFLVWPMDSYLDSDYLFVLLLMILGTAATAGTAAWYLRETRRKEREPGALYLRAVPQRGAAEHDPHGHRAGGGRGRAGGAHQSGAHHQRVPRYQDAADLGDQLHGAAEKGARPLRAGEGLCQHPFGEGGAAEPDRAGRV